MERNKKKLIIALNMNATCIICNNPSTRITKGEIYQFIHFRTHYQYIQKSRITEFTNRISEFFSTFVSEMNCVKSSITIFAILITFRWMHHFFFYYSQPTTLHKDSSKSCDTKFTQISQPFSTFVSEMNRLRSYTTTFIAILMW